MGEAGLEPARPQWTLEPESSESTNSTTRPSLFSWTPSCCSTLEHNSTHIEICQQLFFRFIKLLFHAHILLKPKNWAVHNWNYPWQTKMGMLECFGSQFHMSIDSEWYPRGRRGSPAKGVGRQKRREGSNPSHSAKRTSPYGLVLFWWVYDPDNYNRTEEIAGL